MPIRTERMTAEIEGDFVVFLIGMRINKPWKFWKWLPIFAAMPKMLQELRQHPESGFISEEAWFGRTIVSVQYWRSVEDLIRYAHDKESEHLPAWRDFNRKIARSGDVGVWHETYQVSAGMYETVYANMPEFGLGRAGKLVPAVGRRHSAKTRLGKQETDDETPV